MKHKLASNFAVPFHEALELVANDEGDINPTDGSEELGSWLATSISRGNMSVANSYLQNIIQADLDILKKILSTVQCYKVFHVN